MDICPIQKHTLYMCSAMIHIDLTFEIVISHLYIKTVCQYFCFCIVFYEKKKYTSVLSKLKNENDIMRQLIINCDCDCLNEN